MVGWNLYHAYCGCGMLKSKKDRSATPTKDCTGPLSLFVGVKVLHGVQLGPLLLLLFGEGQLGGSHSVLPGKLWAGDLGWNRRLGLECRGIAGFLSRSASFSKYHSVISIDLLPGLLFIDPLWSSISALDRAAVIHPTATPGVWSRVFAQAVAGFGFLDRRHLFK